MQITKCDICKKMLEKDSKSVHIGVGNVFSNHAEICANCGKSVLKLLKDKKVLKIEDKKDGKK